MNDIRIIFGASGGVDLPDGSCLGVQGEHNAARLVLTLPSAMIEGVTHHVVRFLLADKVLSSAPITETRNAEGAYRDGNMLYVPLTTGVTGCLTMSLRVLAMETIGSAAVVLDSTEPVQGLYFIASDVNADSVETIGLPGADGKDGVGIASISIADTFSTSGDTYLLIITLTDGTSVELPFTVPEGEQGCPGVDGQDGSDGADGVSPTVTVLTNTDESYVLQITDVNGTFTTPNLRAVIPANHTHDDRYYTETEVDTALSGKAAAGHTHDDRYYTEAEVDTMLSGKQPVIDSSHKISSDNVYDTNAENKFVTATEKSTWDSKYDLPSGGVPKTDLSSDVQTSLGKADTALQEHQDISGKADTNHTHDDRYYTETETDTLLSGKAASDHNHDSRYYTESEVDTALAGKAASDHTHSDLAASSHTHDDRYYTESEVDTALAGKAAASHTHDDRYYTETEVDTALSGKAAASHTHDGRYYTESEADVLLSARKARETASIVCPSTFCATVGHEFVLYYNAILRCRRPEDFVVTVSGLDSAILALHPLYDRCLRFTPTAAMVGTQSITLQVIERDSWQIVASKAVSIVIQSDLTLSGKTVLCIGDSLTFDGTVAAELSNMSNGGITSVGTVAHTRTFNGSSVTVNMEGRNGAASYDYVHKTTIGNETNAFYNANETYTRTLDKKYADTSLLSLDNSGSVSVLTHHFDFDYYMTNNPTITPDAVILALGTNGANGYAIDPFMIALDAMIDSIRTYDADLPIFLHLFPPLSGVGNTARNMAVRAVRSVDDSRLGYYDCIAKLIQRYANVVTLIPTNTMLDELYDYKRREAAVSARNSITEVVGGDAADNSDGTHPATAGYLHIADSYYNALIALFTAQGQQPPQDTRVKTWNFGDRSAFTPTTTRDGYYWHTATSYPEINALAGLSDGVYYNGVRMNTSTISNPYWNIEEAYQVTGISASGTSLSFTAPATKDSQGIGIPYHVLAGETLNFSCSTSASGVNSMFGYIVADESGAFVSGTFESSARNHSLSYTATDDCWVILCIGKYAKNTSITITDIAMSITGGGTA